MTRTEYLNELEANLISLPKEERDMAVNFYKEYFDEAGEENEQEVIDDLGKPFNLARSIIGETSLYSRSQVYLDYKASKPMPQNNVSVFASLKKDDAFAQQPVQQDFEPDIMPNAAVEEDIMPNGAAAVQQTAQEQDVMPNGPSAQTNRTSNTNANPYASNVNTYYSSEPKQSSVNGGLLAVLIIALAIVIIPLACGLLPAMLAVGLAACGCLVASVIALIVGIMQIPASLATGLTFVAMALFTAGIGLMMLSGALAFFFRFVPFSIKGIIKLFKKACGQD